MDEYIKRQDAIEAIKNSAPELVYYNRDEAVDAVNAVFAADVAPVRHGKWEGTADGYADGQLVYDIWNCSECGFDADGAEEEPQWKFCPCCGARMDGGADNDTD